MVWKQSPNFNFGQIVFLIKGARGQQGQQGQQGMGSNYIAVNEILQ